MQGAGHHANVGSVVCPEDWSILCNLFKPPMEPRSTKAIRAERCRRQAGWLRKTRQVRLLPAGPRRKNATARGK